MISVPNLVTGTGLPNPGNQDEAEDVVAEHEDKADCVGDSSCVDSHNYPVRLSWIQLWKVSTARGIDGPLSMSKVLELFPQDSSASLSLVFS